MTVKPHHEIIPEINTISLVSDFEQSMALLEEAYELIEKANKIYQRSFGTLHVIYPSTYACHLDTIKKQANSYAWNQIFHMTHLEQIMSVKASTNIKDRINKNEIEPLTQENLNAMLTAAVQNSTDFMQQAIKEIYDFLTPGVVDYFGKNLKTNRKNAGAIGEKVILKDMVEHHYLRYKERPHDFWKVNYARETELIQLDKIFHAIDGKSILNTDAYRSPLVDAIKCMPTSSCMGETEYFRFKCCINTNLHLEFKKPEIVKYINQSVGISNILKGEM